MRILVATAAAILIAACASDFRVELPVHDAAPFASAGTGSTYLVGETVALDASGSFDPDGEIVMYRWSVESRPETSIAAPADATAPQTSLVLDQVGTYVLQLKVLDDAGATATASLTITALGPTIVVDAGSDAAIEWRTPIQLSGTVDVEPGFEITGVLWSVLSGPGPAELTGATTLTPMFTPAVEGTYVLRLTAQTAYNQAVDHVMITSEVPRQFLPDGLVDAEYSKALDKFVIVSQAPAQLVLHDPATGTETSVDLPYVPTSVSVSPDGLRAAVGHSGYASLVDLQTMQVVTTYTMAIDVHDIVFGADDRVHCLEYGGPLGWGELHTIDLQDGSIDTNNGAIVDGLAQARLHPSGIAMYSTRSGSPSDIERFDVSAAPVTRLRDSPYHGEYGFGGNLWFTEDGITIITRSRNLFYSSTNSAVDMTYRATLDGRGSINWAVHSAAAGRIATLAIDYNTNGTQIVGYHADIYEDQQFAAVKRIDLPMTPDNSTYYLSEGRYAAYRSDGSALYAITRAMTGSGPVFVLYVLE